MNEEKIMQLDVTVFGQVQGVGFRFMVIRLAKKYSFVGFVKNQNDQTVHICAVGCKKNLDHFLQEIQKIGFSIDHMKVTFNEKKETFENFSIRH